ncbi:hypothetical protein Hdeb2414_s0005g00172111 [Helianthus debilis subsp. tardiflorus]
MAFYSFFYLYLTMFKNLVCGGFVYLFANINSTNTYICSLHVFYYNEPFNFIHVLTNLIFLKVSKPLKASIKSASLEDSRHLARSCDRLHQEVESQVDAERSYHRHVLSILEELHDELILAKHMQESSSQSATEKDVIVPSGDVTQRVHNENKGYDYFIGKAKVIHPFDAQADGKLSLNVDDYVIVF